MLASWTFWLVSLGVLVTYLSVSVGLRRRAERATRTITPGKAFDVSVIAPQIQRVRQDYLAAARYRSYHLFHSPGLLAAARRLIMGLSFFRRETDEVEVSKQV